MNMNLDDPKLTAYALDELSGAEKTEMETAVASSREAQEFVRELRLAFRQLASGIRERSASAHPIARTNIVPLEQNRRAVEHLAPTRARGCDRAFVPVIGAVAIGTLTTWRVCER